MSRWSVNHRENKIPGLNVLVRRKLLRRSNIAMKAQNILIPEIRDTDRFIILRGQMICFNHPSGVVEHRDYGDTYGGGPIRTAAEAFKTLYEAIPESYKTVADRDKEIESSTFSEEEEEQMEEYRRSKDKENPDSRNRWAKALGSSHTYDAAKLLDLIRPEVEDILVIAGITSPPSQSARVQECLANMEAKYDEILDGRDESSDPRLNMRQGFRLRKTINVLKAFQAVHKTITLLEGVVI